MNEITFLVRPDLEEGGYTAWWDDEPGRGGITTEGDTLDHLREMVADAIAGYFEPGQKPRGFKLHFVEDPAFELV